MVVRVLRCTGPNKEGSLAVAIGDWETILKPPEEARGALKELQKLVEKWAEIVKSE